MKKGGRKVLPAEEFCRKLGAHLVSKRDPKKRSLKMLECHRRRRNSIFDTNSKVLDLNHSTTNSTVDLSQTHLEFNQKRQDIFECPFCGMIYNYCDEDILLHKKRCLHFRRDVALHCAGPKKKKLVDTEIKTQGNEVSKFLDLTNMRQQFVTLLKCRIFVYHKLLLKMIAAVNVSDVIYPLDTELLIDGGIREEIPREKKLGHFKEKFSFYKIDDYNQFVGLFEEYRFSSTLALVSTDARVRNILHPKDNNEAATEENVSTGFCPFLLGHQYSIPILEQTVSAIVGVCLSQSNSDTESFSTKDELAELVSLIIYSSVKGFAQKEKTGLDQGVLKQDSIYENKNKKKNDASLQTELSSETKVPQSVLMQKLLSMREMYTKRNTTGLGILNNNVNVSSLIKCGNATKRVRSNDNIVCEKEEKVVASLSSSGNHHVNNNVLVLFFFLSPHIVFQYQSKRNEGNLNLSLMNSQSIESPQRPHCSQSDINSFFCQLDLTSKRNSNNHNKEDTRRHDETKKSRQLLLNVSPTKYLQFLWNINMRFLLTVSHPVVKRNAVVDNNISMGESLFFRLKSTEQILFSNAFFHQPLKTLLGFRFRELLLTWKKQSTANTNSYAEHITID